MLVAGLSGNYGMGKSTVLQIFGELGAVTLDVDEVVDRLLLSKSVLDRIRRTLGDGVFYGDGQLDRTKVAVMIFGDTQKRNTLEGILHPLVFEEIAEFIKVAANADTGDGVAVIEIPLMFEKEQAGRFHKTITVCADEETVFRRLREKGIEREDAEARLRAQLDIGEKVRRSDFVIDNSGPINETRAKVMDIYRKLLECKKHFRGE